MTTVLIVIGSIAAIVGVGVATWSIVSTRKKYYKKKENFKHENNRNSA